MARLTIFHTSDLHNKLTPELAQRLHDLVAATPHCLMLDCGDALWAGNLFWRPGGEPILDLMNSVPYDAMCMGNREFHFSERGVRAKLSRAEFPVISANLRATGEDSDDNASLAATLKAETVGFVRFHFDPVIVAVLGITVPCIAERMLSKKVSDFYLADPIESAREIVPMLRECDLVVALTHIGLKKDIELAEKVPGIDIILGGHTHMVAEERVGDTMIFHSGHHAHHVRKLEIEVGKGKPRVDSELIPLDEA